MDYGWRLTTAVTTWLSSTAFLPTAAILLFTRKSTRFSALPRCSTASGRRVAATRWGEALRTRSRWSIPLEKKLASAREERVDLITTVCPGCNTALDREQPNLVERGMGEFAIPVIDLGQLIALALGVPVEKLGFAANTVSVDPVLERLGLKESA